jgi:hypothetical protein
MAILSLGRSVRIGVLEDPTSPRISIPARFKTSPYAAEGGITGAVLRKTPAWSPL